MGLGLSNELIVLGMMLARIRFLNIGMSPTSGGDEQQTEQRETYRAALAFAAEGAPLSGRCLEVCAGMGEGAELMRRSADWRVCALDGARTSTALARFRGVSVMRGLVETMPFDDHSFDHVIGVECVVCLDDPRGGLTEISRVLKPGGVLTLAEFRLGGLDAAKTALSRVAAEAGLALSAFRDETASARDSVMSGIDERARWVRFIPPPFRGWARDLASLPGSQRYREWESGQRCYYLARLSKPT
ncbi:MAG: class I SAM-dependent methyltransferase [Pseudomonadota bacterium]